MSSHHDRDLAARVVAWHNRHPLARRITPAQVSGLGVVVLPFLAQGNTVGSAAAPVRNFFDTAVESAADGATTGAAAAGAADVLAIDAPANGAPTPHPAQRADPLNDEGADPAAADPLAPPHAGSPLIAAATTTDPASAPPRVALAPALAPTRWAHRLADWWRRRRPASARPVLTPNFTEDFIAPLSPRQVARFALRHGSAVRPGPSDGPQRFVVVDAPGSPNLVPRFVCTASIELDGGRARVLVGEGERAAVIGPRLWSRYRVGGATALGLCGLVALLATPLWGHGPADPSLVPVAGAASAPTAVLAAASAASAAPAAVLASTASATSAAHEVAVAAASAATQAPAAASAVTVSASASAPTSGEPVAAAGHGMPPDIRPRLSAEQREAARRAAALVRGVPFEAAGKPPAAAAPAGLASPVYALVTRTTRGRAASEVMLSLMVSAAAGAVLHGQPRPEVMQVAEGWRAVWWPFDSPAAVEQARAVLAQYGINAEIVAF